MINRQMLQTEQSGECSPSKLAGRNRCTPAAQSMRIKPSGLRDQIQVTLTLWPLQAQVLAACDHQHSTGMTAVHRRQVSVATMIRHVCSTRGATMPMLMLYRLGLATSAAPPAATAAFVREPQPRQKKHPRATPHHPCAAYSVYSENLIATKYGFPCPNY